MNQAMSEKGPMKTMARKIKQTTASQVLFIVAILLLFPAFGKAQVPVALAPSIHPQFFDGTGKPLSGGELFFYAAGTTTLQATFADNLGTIQNPNPVLLDATGVPSNASGAQIQIWLTNTSYKICGYSSALVQQFCWDNVSAYQILNNVQNIVLGGVTVDPSALAGELWYRSDLGCFRGYTTFADCFATWTGVQTLTNKTFDVSANTLKNSANTAGHYLRNNGTQYVDGTIQSSDLPAQYTKFECAPGLGDGLNSITAGTYLQFNCVNKSGVTWTITGISCWTDNAGASTLNAANNAGTGLLTGAVTCNNTKANGGNAGTQSATVTLAAGDAISFTFVADGTTKQTTWTVTLTQ